MYYIYTHIYMEDRWFSFPSSLTKYSIFFSDMFIVKNLQSANFHFFLGDFIYFWILWRYSMALDFYSFTVWLGMELALNTLDSLRIVNIMSFIKSEKMFTHYFFENYLYPFVFILSISSMDIHLIVLSYPPCLLIYFPNNPSLS